MKDLDFDELDRAVNSLLTNTNAPTPEKPADPAVVAAPVGETVDAAPVVAATAPTAPITSPSTPLAARRSSGRFMDVVHPSSDMRTATVPQRPISREGVQIAAPSVRSTEISNNSLPILTQSEPSQASVEVKPPEAGEWPDPLDFSGFSQNESSTPTQDSSPQDTPPPADLSVEADDDKDLDQIADEINQTLSADLPQDTQAPLESPFLTDAKVEKRPLGAFSNEVPVAPLESTPEVVAPEPVVEAANDPDDNKLAHQEDSPMDDTPLPAELQDDLLSIESDTDSTGQLKKEEALPPQVTPVVPSAPVASIPQQYTERPSTGDQPAGAIFDTGAYQKPLAHPTQKKSGWMMIVWIVLLLIVGAGAGAAVYFWVLPTL